jgi:hypothetical protein
VCGSFGAHILKPLFGMVSIGVVVLLERAFHLPVGAVGYVDVMC